MNLQFLVVSKFYLEERSNHMKFLSKRLTILFFISISLSCILNPIVQTVVNPEDSSEPNPITILGIVAALSPQSIQITGQIMDANGIAVSNGTLTILSRSNPSEGLLDSVDLNYGGRFYMKVSTGDTRIRVSQSNVELFTFTLSIPELGIISVSNQTLAGPRINNLEFYQIGFEPNYFDVFAVNPFDQSSFTAWPSIIQITFTEDIEVPSNMQTYLDTNVSTSPTISLDGSLSSVINGKILEIRNSSGFQIGTNRYTLGIGIRSASGKILSPRSFSYTCNAPCSSPL